MTRNEIVAFNRGITTMLALAASAAQAIRTAPGYRPTRDGFAAEALAALAEEGRELLLDDPGADLVAIDLPAPDRLGSGGESAAVPCVSVTAE